MPVIYIDVLFGVNFILNYLLLRCAGALCRNRPPAWRTAIGALLGAAYAVAAFFPAMTPFYSLLFKLLASGLMTAAAFPLYGVGEFIKLTGVFYAVSLLLGGLSFALLFIAGPGAVCSNGIMYPDIPFSALFFGAAAFYGLVRLWEGAAAIRRRRGARHKVIVELNGKKAVLTALADTGNILVDPISRVPVIVAELDALKELFDYSTWLELGGQNLQTGLGTMTRLGLRARLIPFSSVGEGEGMMVGFVPDRAAVRRGGGLRPVNCVIGVCPRPLSADKSYDALYNPD